MANDKLKFVIEVDDKGSPTIRQFGDTVEKATGKAEKSTRKMGTAFSNAIKTTAGFAAGAVSIGLVKSAVESTIRAGADFEQQMINVGAVMRLDKSTAAGAANLAKLEAAAKLMGETTEHSASTSAEAIRLMGMAGWDTQQSIAALPGLLDLATAGSVELGTAADIVTDQMTAFGMAADQTGRFNDALLGTITRANTDIPMLGESLKYVGPVAKAAGQDIESTASQIGILANAGIKGSEAGTALRSILNKTATAAETLARTTGADLNPETATLKDVMRAAADAGWGLKDMTKEFGLEASTAAIVLKDNVKGLDDLEAALRSNEGEAKDMASTMRGSTNAAFKEFQSVIEGIKLDIFKEYKDTVRDATKSATQFFRDHKDEIVEFMRGLKASVEAVIKVVGGFAEATAGVVDFATKISRAAGAISTSEVAMSDFAGTGASMEEALKAIETGSMDTYRRLKEMRAEMIAMQREREKISSYNQPFMRDQDKIDELTRDIEAAKKEIQAFQKQAGQETEMTVDITATGSTKKPISEKIKEIEGLVSGFKKNTTGWESTLEYQIDLGGGKKAFSDGLKDAEKLYGKYTAAAGKDGEQLYTDLARDSKDYFKDETDRIADVQRDFGDMADENAKGYGDFKTDVTRDAGDVFSKLGDINTEFGDFQGVGDDNETAFGDFKSLLSREKETTAGYLGDINTEFGDFQGVGDDNETAFGDFKTLLGKEKTATAQYLKDVNDEFALFDDIEALNETAFGDFKKRVIDDTPSVAEQFGALAGMVAGIGDNFDKVFSEDQLRDVQTFQDNMEGIISDSLVGLATGQFESLSEAWDAMWKSMLDMLIETVAEMAVEWAVAEGMNMLGGLVGSFFHEGAWDTSDASSMEAGGLQPDEIPAILQSGEMVIPREESEAIRAYAAAAGVDDFDELAQLVGSNAYMGSMIGLGLQMTGGQGGASGADTSGDVSGGSSGAEMGAFGHGAVDAATSSAAQMAATAVSGALTGSFTPGAVISHNLSSFGLSTVMGGIHGVLGISGQYGQYGSSFLGGLMGMAMGPVGGMIGGLLGGYAGTAIADALNARSAEVAMDAIEAGFTSQYGSILGHLVGYTHSTAAASGLSGMTGMGGDPAAGLGVGAVAGGSLGTYGGGSTAGFGMSGNPGTLGMGSHSVGAAIASALGLNGQFGGYSVTSGDIAAATGAGGSTGTGVGAVGTGGSIAGGGRSAGFGGASNPGSMGGGNTAGTGVGGGDGGDGGVGGDSGGTSAGGVGPGAGGGTSPGADGYAAGGIIDRLIVPRGEDGYAAVQYGEGVVSHDGMAALDRINAGEAPETMADGGIAIANMERLLGELVAIARRGDQFNINVNLNGRGLERIIEDVTVRRAERGLSGERVLS